MDIEPELGFMGIKFGYYSVNQLLFRATQKKNDASSQNFGITQRFP